MKYSPIVLFVYNRPEHTEQTVEALKENKQATDSDLYIYSDAPKHEKHEESVRVVREYLKNISGFKSVTIVEREKNWGLADSIVDGVTAVVEKYGRVIVLEDDIVTSQFFLQYMNDALELYQDEERVMHVSGYFFPVESKDLSETFFYNQASCWGWATWSRAWQHMETDTKKLLSELASHKNKHEYFKSCLSQLRANARGDIKTWAAKWQACILLQEGLCLHPRLSFTYNIGNDGSGEHGQHHIALANQKLIATSTATQSSHKFLEENQLAAKLGDQFQRQLKPHLLKRLLSKIIR